MSLSNKQKIDLFIANLVKDVNVVGEINRSNSDNARISEVNIKVFKKDSIPWCGTYLGQNAKENNVFPNPYSARAIDYSNNSSYNIRQVLSGKIKLEKGWYAIKSRPGGNHVGVILSYDQSKRTIDIVSGNVGDSVRIQRNVKLSLTNKYGYTSFTKTIIKNDVINLSNKDVGIASYYSNKFEGKTTANGEIFRQNKLTAASNKYPFGTRLRVFNPKNKKSVIVRVNDTGGFKKYNRIIDLSKSAADSIGILNQGIAKVYINKLGK